MMHNAHYLPPRSKAIREMRQVRASRACVINKAFILLRNECIDRINERRMSTGEDSLYFDCGTVLKSPVMKKTGIYESEYPIIIQYLMDFLTQPEEKGGKGYDVDTITRGYVFLDIYWGEYDEHYEPLDGEEEWNISTTNAIAIKVVEVNKPE